MAKATENKQIETMLAPVIAFNKLLVSNAETAINMQLDTFQTLTKLGLDNVNASLEVRDTDDLKAYAEKQKDVAQEVASRVTSDIKALGELNARFIEDARGLAEENVKKTQATAKKAA